jgi:hypothetical protein
MLPNPSYYRASSRLGVIGSSCAVPHRKVDAAIVDDPKNPTTSRTCCAVSVSNNSSASDVVWLDPCLDGKIRDIHPSSRYDGGITAPRTLEFCGGVSIPRDSSRRAKDGCCTEGAISAIAGGVEHDRARCLTQSPMGKGGIRSDLSNIGRRNRVSQNYDNVFSCRSTGGGNAMGNSG